MFLLALAFSTFHRRIDAAPLPLTCLLIQRRLLASHELFFSLSLSPFCSPSSLTLTHFCSSKTTPYPPIVLYILVVSICIRHRILIRSYFLFCLFFFSCYFVSCSAPLQQFGPILDVEIIFNERGSKVRPICLPPFSFFFSPFYNLTFYSSLIDF